ncbi:hypothetical protein [Paractinoplanes rishiriensis]|uniref:Uncharacterized protein n=1 Tax=Paractinoplanes rishiriensis TaxID=1050105 RepID=A0A919K6K9_9ACTN|nr:hypothetical protein [Actinoplanes rishiriensis]GIE99483.1 hypothetical protein Ari01nite_69480 [Actinoplanes rishiriensis]
MTGPTSTPGARRPAPPASVVAAARADYDRVRPKLAEAVVKVRAELAAGADDFEAVADVWLSLLVQQYKPETLLLAAIAIVQVAKEPHPQALTDPDNQK